MAVNVSTGYAAAILGPQSFDQIFRYGCIEVYSGEQPDSADLAATGTLLARITRDGGAWEPGDPENGVEFSRTGRYALKPAGHTWALVGIADGVAGWARLRANAPETPGENVVAPRIDGLVGLEGDVADIQLFLPSLNISGATLIPITHWWYAVPPIGA